MILSDVTFPAHRLDILPLAGTFHFWHTPRRYLLARMVERFLQGPEETFLDIGCGNGALVQLLRSRGWNARGLDPYARHCGLDPAVFLEGSLMKLPFEERSQEMVGLFDVLEHVDDTICLQEVVRVLKPGGRCLVSVPACPSLWSQRDVEAGHRRRYTRATLRSLMEGAGFHLESFFGYQAFLLPVLLVSRWLGRGSSIGVKREDHPPVWANRVLSIPNWVEASLSPWIRPPYGSSLMAVGRLPAA